MITREQAEKEILRLKILEKYPKRAEGEEGLITALMESAETVYVAERFVTGCIRTAKRCPMPCDIYQSLDSTARIKSTIQSLPKLPKGAEVPPPEFFCNLCEDTGWEHVTLKQEIPDLPGQHYTGVRRCTHPARWTGTKSRAGTRV